MSNRYGAVWGVSYLTISPVTSSSSSLATDSDGGSAMLICGAQDQKVGRNCMSELVHRLIYNIFEVRFEGQSLLNDDSKSCNT